VAILNGRTVTAPGSTKLNGSADPRLKA